MNKFLFGAMLGVVAGLLLAPEKGSDMRDDVAEAARKLKRQFDKMMGRDGVEVGELKRMLEREVHGLKDDVRTRLRTILNEAKTHN